MRIAARIGLAVAVTVSSLGLWVASASAAIGDLTFQSCIDELVGGNCTTPPISRLDNVNDLALSPLGDSLYVASAGSSALTADDSVVHYTRAAGGTLTFEGCWDDDFIEDGTAECATQTAPDSELDGSAGVAGVAVSPDGLSVYAVADSERAITHFTRAAGGAFFFQACIDDTLAPGCLSVPAEMLGASGVSVSPNNASVYVISDVDDSITHFTRSPIAPVGSLGFGGCIDLDVGGGEDSDCTTPAGFALGNPENVVVSPDNEDVYVTSSISNSVTHFSRAGDGSLTFEDCLDDLAGAPCTTPAQATLAGASGLAISTDGNSVYVGSFTDDAVTQFSRDGNGDLAFSGCIDAAVGGNCTTPAGFPASIGSTELAITPNGETLYSSDQFSSTVTQFGLGGGGVLSYQRCYDELVVSTTCVSNGAEAISSPAALAATNDSVYVGTFGAEDSINHYTRQTTPDPIPPDSDGDGTDDTIDRCLLEPGPAPSGCPDTDGDGIVNPDDQCPTVPGVAPTGCPAGDPNVRDPNLITPGSTLGELQIDPNSADALCKGKKATVLGSHGQDLLLGRPGNDVIVAGRGNDVVRGLGGNDLVCLGGGNDRGNGGGGNDRVLGGSGRDRLSGSSGNDRLIGGRGRDRCAGGAGRDRGSSCEQTSTVP